MLIFYFFWLLGRREGFQLLGIFVHLLYRKDFIISGEKRPFRYCRAFIIAYLSSALLIWSDFLFSF